MKTRPITVAETQAFARSAAKIWNEAELAELVDYVAHNPESGDVIQGTGGVRKLRWGKVGSGKRGGARVIYFYYTPTPREGAKSAARQQQEGDSSGLSFEALVVVRAHIGKLIAKAGHFCIGQMARSDDFAVAPHRVAGVRVLDPVAPRLGLVEGRAQDVHAAIGGTWPSIVRQGSEPFGDVAFGQTIDVMSEKAPSMWQRR